MLNTGYMEFFYNENFSKTKDIDFLKSFFTDDEKILFCFSGLRDRLAFFTTKRLVFMYSPDKLSRQLDFVQYNKITSYNVVTSAEYTNVKLELNLPYIGIIGFNFSNIDTLMKSFAFLSKVI